MFAQQIDAERVSLRCGTFPKVYKNQKELEKNYSPEAICRKKIFLLQGAICLWYDASTRLCRSDGSVCHKKKFRYPMLTTSPWPFPGPFCPFAKQQSLGRWCHAYVWSAACRIQQAFLWDKRFSDFFRFFSSEKCCAKPRNCCEKPRIRAQCRFYFFY